MKLKEMFDPGWYEILEPFLEGEQFKTIGKTLIDLSKKGTVITPDFSDTFRAFKECKWSNINTVILGMDPYPGIVKENGKFMADGLAFSSRDSVKCPKSLNYIISAIDRDVYQTCAYHICEKTFDLSYWAKQGVLLLNVALTFPIGGRAGAHIPMWTPFTAFVLQRLVQHKDMLSCILMGAEAKKFEKLLRNNTTFQVLTCDHPASAVYKPGGKWNDNKVFLHHEGFMNFQNININWE